MVLLFNAEGVDGRDPSWLYDVSFASLRGRDVRVQGRRATDLLVRLAVRRCGGARGAGPAGRRPRHRAGRRGRRDRQLHGVPIGARGAARWVTSLSIVHVYPDLLGTYGDRGNATVARPGAPPPAASGWWSWTSGRRSPIPTQGDVYVLGGGEDAAQALAARDSAGGRPGVGPCHERPDPRGVRRAPAPGPQLPRPGRTAAHRARPARRRLRAAGHPSRRARWSASRSSSTCRR